MKKLAACFVIMFILSPRYFAKEIIKSKEAEKIKIEPAQPLTVNIKLPYKKNFKVKEVKFELDNIGQDLSGQYILAVSNNNRGDSESSEVAKDKTWVVQEIVANDRFELSRIEIKMEVPLEDNQELLVCDNDLYEKTRGVIKYDESRKECFVVLNPTVQVQENEHIFIAIKLAETPINVKTGPEERLIAFYTEYPDGFKERDPFPEFLKKGLTSSKNSLIYKLYSKEPSDVQPSFHIKVDDGFNPVWTWNGEEKMVLKDKNILESIDMYFSENRNSFNERDDIILPFVFTPENSTYPINLQLASWEMEIKTPEDYFMELKSAVEEIFKDNEETKTNLVNKLKEMWDSFKDDAADDLKEKISSFAQDLYSEQQEAKTKGDENEIKGVLALTDELKSIL
ncbi:MAG: hypothetical protein AB1498_02020 [bacterium]